jgi:hypothetical protein
METNTLRNVPPVKQFAVLLQNRVGALASLVKLLRSKGIEVIGLCVQDSRDATLARLVTSDPEQTEELFIEKGIPHTTCELLVVALHGAADDFQSCLDQLMAAETNVDFVYSLMPCPNERCLVAMHVEDLSFAASVLHRAGFKVLGQDDLSR